jgi:hypothetical protein
MQDHDMETFKQYLQEFLNEELSEESWDQFEGYLQTHQEARTLYRQAMAMEMDLEDIFEKSTEQAQNITEMTAPAAKSNSKWVLIAALLLFALLPFALIQIELPKRKSNLPDYVTKESFAIITEAESVYKDLSDHKIEPYRVVGREKIAFKSGKVRLEYYNGAIVELVGPCEYYVQSADRSFLNQGTVSAKVTPESQGFKIFSPGVSLVDLGTEFSLNVDEEKQTHVHVFEGEAEVSLLNQRGETVRSENVLSKNGYSLNPSQQTIQNHLDKFEPIRIQNKSAGLLPYKQKIMAVAKADDPIYQWGAQIDVSKGFFHNLNQPMSLMPSTNVSQPSSWVSERPLSHFSESEFTLEFWFNAETIHRGAMFSLLKALPGQSHENWSDIENIHFLYMELESDAKDTMHTGCCVRFLVRSPSNLGGGVNLFSQKKYIPGKWHHIVATSDEENMELYMDGLLQASYPIKKVYSQDQYFGYIGALSPSKMDSRIFQGQLDGISIYNKKLSSEMVKQHFMARFPDS